MKNNNKFCNTLLAIQTKRKTLLRHGHGVSINEIIRFDCCITKKVILSALNASASIVLYSVLKNSFGNSGSSFGVISDTPTYRQMDKRICQSRFTPKNRGYIAIVILVQRTNLTA